MADDRNTQTVYASLQAEINRLSSRNEDIYVKLDSLNSQLALIPWSKMDKKRQVNQQINQLQREQKDNSRRISQLADDQKRLQIVQDRTDAKTEAYRAGIDPNKAWSDAISGGLGATASIVGSLSGAGVFGKKQPKPSEITGVSPDVVPEKKNNTVMIVVALLVAYLIFKK